jgi:hypothetical protein
MRHFVDVSDGVVMALSVRIGLAALAMRVETKASRFTTRQRFINRID